jgi:hypothetical protein
VDSAASFSAGCTNCSLGEHPDQKIRWAGEPERLQHEAPERQLMATDQERPNATEGKLFRRIGLRISEKQKHSSPRAIAANKIRCDLKAFQDF